MKFLGIKRRGETRSEHRSAATVNAHRAIVHMYTLVWGIYFLKLALFLTVAWRSVGTMQQAAVGKGLYSRLLRRD